MLISLHPLFPPFGLVPISEMRVMRGFLGILETNSAGSVTQ